MGMIHDVHRIRYAWSENSLLGSLGMGPVAATLPHAELEEWDRVLRDHVWAARDGTVPGYVYLTVSSGIGVLIRKVPAVAPDGRQASAAEALLGEKLTAPVALGLTLWSGWDAPGFAPLAWRDLEERTPRRLAALRDRIRRMPPERLAGLFCRVLATLGESRTVVGANDAPAVVCAIGDLLGEFSSFATHESDDTGEHLPPVVFLREAPEFSPVVVARRRLRWDSGEEDPVLGPFAEALVASYLGQGHSALVAVRRQRPPRVPAEAITWAETMQFAPGVLADLAALPTAAPARLPGLATREAMEKIAKAARDAGAESLLRPLGCPLPESVDRLLKTEAVSRIMADPGQDVLLDGLARHGPLPSAMLTPHSSTGLHHYIRVTSRLAKPDERRVLLRRFSRQLELEELIEAIDSADADAVEALFVELCLRARRASAAEVETLVARRGLVDALRRTARCETAVSARLSTLFNALPRGALRRPGVFDALVARPDVAVLHALELCVEDETLLRRLGEQALLELYHLHGLPPPRSYADIEDEPRGRGWIWLAAAAVTVTALLTWSLIIVVRS